MFSTSTHMFWTSRFICFQLRFLYIRLRIRNIRLQIRNIRLRIRNIRLRIRNIRLRRKYYCSYFCPQRNAIVPQNIVTKITQVESRAELNEPNSTVMASAHKQYVTTLIKDFHVKVTEFKAGRISTLMKGEELATSDPEILDLVTGYAIKLTEGPPPCNQSNYAFSLFEQKIIDFEISKLLMKHAIVPSCHEAGEVTHQFLSVPKKWQSSHDIKLKTSQ